MKELIGLLCLICLVAIVVFLAAQKQIGTGMTITLLSFAVVGGFAIARFDWVKSLAAGKDGIKTETFQQRVDTITGEAVTKVQTEVAAQKQSLKMVIADANTTREKLDTQKKSLEELYSKTKAMERRLHEQNKEIEKTIEKSSQMEASISTAQSVIAKLDHETQVADEKIKLLDEKTTGISRTADGRLKIGGMIAGESSLLEEQGKKIINALNAQDWSTCFEQSRIAIEMIDESEKKAKGAGMSVATLNATFLAQVYQIASGSARLTNHFVQSVEWAKDAIKNEDTGSRRAALVLSLRASNETVEAQKAVDEALTIDPKLAEEFRSTLARAGSPL